jgi:hypothetical protein
MQITAKQTKTYFVHILDETEDKSQFYALQCDSEAKKDNVITDLLVRRSKHPSFILATYMVGKVVIVTSEGNITITYRQ